MKREFRSVACNHDFQKKKKSKHGKKKASASLSAYRLLQTLELVVQCLALCPGPVALLSRCHQLLLQRASLLRARTLLGCQGRTQLLQCCLLRVDLKDVRRSAIRIESQKTLLLPSLSLTFCWSWDLAASSDVSTEDCLVSGCDQGLEKGPAEKFFPLLIIVLFTSSSNLCIEVPLANEQHVDFTVAPLKRKKEKKKKSDGMLRRW